MTVLMTDDEQGKLEKYLSKNYPKSRKQNLLDWTIKALEDTDILAGTYSADVMFQAERAKKAEALNIKHMSEIKRLKTKVNRLTVDNAALKSRLRVASRSA